MKVILVQILFFIPFIIYAQKEVKNTPSWVDNPPKNGKYIYSVGIGTSQQLSYAKDKAELEAKNKIAHKIGNVITTFSENTDTFFKNDIQYIQTIKKIKTSVSVELAGVEFKEDVYVIKNGTYNCYILLCIERETLKQSYLNKIDKEKLLRDKIVKAGLYNDIKKIK